MYVESLRFGWDLYVDLPNSFLFIFIISIGCIAIPHGLFPLALTSRPILVIRPIFSFRTWRWRW